jgi:hypothetical protein
MAKPQGNRVKLLIGTRKGAFTLTSDPVRSTWNLEGPLYLGHIIYHYMVDPRDANSQVMAMKAGHLGPTVFFSKDAGKTWKEASKPPQFPKAPEKGDGTPDPEKSLAEMAEARKGDQTGKYGGANGAKDGSAVDIVFWLSPGHESQAGVWYAGTAPPGMFITKDGGDTWAPVEGFNTYCQANDGLNGEGATPGGQLTHSILIDPRDAKHMYVSISVGGTFESTDAGASWTPMNKGVHADFLPDPEVPYGHDPHFVVMHPKNPDRLYQQNHCGIYRIDRPDVKWVRVGDNMPKEAGDIGFPIVVHPHDVDRAWVFPMDGTEVWPRTSPGGRPAVYETRDGGSSWHRHDRGLPEEHGYFTVKRQAMTNDAMLPLGLYFGTTCGEVYGSIDEGASYNCLVRHLPEIYSITATLD